MPLFPWLNRKTHATDPSPNVVPQPATAPQHEDTPQPDPLVRRRRNVLGTSSQPADYAPASVSAIPPDDSKQTETRESPPAPKRPPTCLTPTPLAQDQAHVAPGAAGTSRQTANANALPARPKKRRSRRVWPPSGPLFPAYWTSLIPAEVKSAKSAQHIAPAADSAPRDPATSRPEQAKPPVQQPISMPALPADNAVDSQSVAAPEPARTTPHSPATQDTKVTPPACSPASALSATTTPTPTQSPTMQQALTSLQESPAAEGHLAARQVETPSPDRPPPETVAKPAFAQVQRPIPPQATRPTQDPRPAPPIVSKPITPTPPPTPNPTGTAQQPQSQLLPKPVASAEASHRPDIKSLRIRRTLPWPEDDMPESSRS